MADDILFAYIEKQHKGRPWGRVLDAGTGDHSLRWIQGLPTTGWTAVTVDAQRYSTMQAALPASMRPTDALLLGDWTDPTLLQDERFDVVLVDYLIGALDAFTPFFQHQILARLRPHLRDRLYLIGWEPFPAHPKDPAHRLVVELARTKDACRLLAGQRPYREYPASWVEHQLQHDGYQVLDVKHFTNIFRERYVTSQVNACLRSLSQIPDAPLAAALRQRIQRLQSELHPHASAPSGIRLGADYIITATPSS